MATAAAQRGRDYTAINAVTIRWERDGTEAIKDSNYFQQMLETLRVTPAIELVIRSSDASPAITFNLALLDLIVKSKAKTDKEHTLIIIHYADHGIIKNGTFTFTETRAGSRMINADNTFTAKLAGEIARRKRSGHKHVEFADIFQTIRSRGDSLES